MPTSDRPGDRPLAAQAETVGQRVAQTAQDTLIGVASAAAKDHIGDWIPGFGEHFDQASKRAGRTRSAV